MNWSHHSVKRVDWEKNVLPHLLFCSTCRVGASRLFTKNPIFGILSLNGALHCASLLGSFPCRLTAGPYIWKCKADNKRSEENGFMWGLMIRHLNNCFIWKYSGSYDVVDSDMRFTATSGQANNDVSVQGPPWQHINHVCWCCRTVLKKPTNSCDQRGAREHVQIRLWSVWLTGSLINYIILSIIL